jgi:hypothetical protein
MKILDTLFLALAFHGSSTSIAGAPEPLPPSRWLVHASAFVVQYHEDFGYAPGIGVQMAVGHRLRAGIEGVMKFGYSRPSQDFLWLGETQSLKTDWYRWQLALRLPWPPSHSTRFHLFAEVQSGWVYLHPHTLALDGGARGTVFINPKDEIKFAPALATGCSYGLAKRVAAYLQIELGWLKQPDRRLNETAPPAVWKPLRQLGAGVMLHF